MSNLFTARIVLGSAIILAIAAAAIGATFAFLSDTENSEGNTFDAGALDLKIDNTSYYNGAESPTTTWELDDLDGHLFFDFRDVKPGDWGEDTISIHVVNNNAFGCFDSTLTSDDDVSSNEPELLVDDPEDENNLLDGELGSSIDFIFWVDDGDNVLEATEALNGIISQGKANQVLNGLSVTLADSLTNLFGGNPGDPLVGAQTYYIAKAWCFGTLTQSPVADGAGVDPTVNGGITCDGTGLDNSTQTDKLTADIMFSAIQHRDNPSFTCDPITPTVTPTPSPTPVLFSCVQESNPVYGASVVNSLQGRLKNGNVITDGNRTLATRALGAPESLGNADDNPVTIPSFFSLGFPHTSNGNIPGELVVDMGQTFYPNSGGADLFIYETTGGASYPVETTTVYAKQNLGDGWTLLGNVSRDNGVELSTGGLNSARYVRLVEASNIVPFELTADGYDVDALKALCTQPQ